MQLKRYENNPILVKNSKNSWEAGSVLNPNVIFDNGVFRMTYRATNDVKTEVKGRYMSSIGYAESEDGVHFIRSESPLISPDKEFESLLGCEDPRVTKINDTYYLFYTAVGGEMSKKKVRIALATSKDFVTWNKKGIVGPKYTRSKAAALFPEKISDKFTMLYTWMSDKPQSSIMKIQFNTFDELLDSSEKLFSENINHYQENAIFELPKPVFRGPEVGAPPIKINDGWLVIYCPANSTNHPEWSIGAAVLDYKNPSKIITQSKQPILKPSTNLELSGVVNNVTFPSGAVLVNDELYVYYGSGDQGCCLATCKLHHLLNALN